jgi:hypothetical protein
VAGRRGGGSARGSVRLWASFDRRLRDEVGGIGEEIWKIGGEEVRVEGGNGGGSVEGGVR